MPHLGRPLFVRKLDRASRRSAGSVCSPRFPEPTVSYLLSMSSAASAEYNSFCVSVRLYAGCRHTKCRQYTFQVETCLPDSTSRAYLAFSRASDHHVGTDCADQLPHMYHSRSRRPVVGEWSARLSLVRCLESGPPIASVVWSSGIFSSSFQR
jgi:hypothetical protein